MSHFDKKNSIHIRIVLPQLSYFMSTYFTPDLDREQLPHIMNEFIKVDSSRVNDFICELKSIREKNNWHELSYFMEHYGRDYTLPQDISKLKELINLLISFLTLKCCPNKAISFNQRRFLNDYKKRHR